MHLSHSILQDHLYRLRRDFTKNLKMNTDWKAPLWEPIINPPARAAAAINESCTRLWKVLSARVRVIYMCDQHPPKQCEIRQMTVSFQVIIMEGEMRCVLRRQVLGSALLGRKCLWSPAKREIQKLIQGEKLSVVVWLFSFYSQLFTF